MSAPLTPPADVARECLRSALEQLTCFGSCPFCTLGEYDGVADDGDEQEQHGEECPLFGYDKTADVETLQAWADAP